MATTVLSNLLDSKAQLPIIAWNLLGLDMALP